MLDLKDIAIFSFNEGLLDDIDDQLANGDKIMDLERAKKWSEKSRKKAYYAKQKKGFVFFGDFDINDIDEIKYSGTPIKKVTGNISISNCEIRSLEGIFLPDCEITGTLTIEDNPSLISLAGCPAKVGTLVISGNKNLKTIDTTPIVVNNMYVFKNGKKFDKEKLKAEPNVRVLKNIFCSVLSDEDLVNEGILLEAFKAPQLQILMDAVKKASVKDKNARHNMSTLCGGMEWDKIKASDVYEISGGVDAITMLKPYRTGKRTGFFFTLDKDGNVIGLFGGKRYTALRDTYYKIDKYDGKRDMDNYDFENAIKNADTVIIVDISGYETNWKVRSERSTAKNGATALMMGKERKNNDHVKIDAKNVRYFQEIADENRKRYQQMLVKLKAERASKVNNFTELKTKIDALFKRYTNLLEKVLQNPSKYNYYDIEFLNDKFKHTQQYSKYSNKDYGLLPAIEKYFEAIIEGSQGKHYAYHGVDITTRLKELEDNIRTNISYVENKLKDLENK